MIPLETNIKQSLIDLYGEKKVYSHVQSMFFCIPLDYFEFLVSHHFFEYNKADNNFKELIITKEIGISQCALNNGWNINCLLPIYKDINYRSIDFDINKSSILGDPYHPNSYFEKNIEKTDVIFFKNTRFEK
jgi:hypothetical protein